MELEELRWSLARTIEAGNYLSALLVEAEAVAKGKPSPSAVGKKKSEDDGEDSDEDGDGKGKGKPSKYKWKPFTRKRLIPGAGGDSWDNFEDWMPPTRAIPAWEKPITEDMVDAYSAASNQWAPMDIERPALRKPKWAKGVGCTDAGSIFRAPYRLTTDQKVFRQNRAKRSGSLLIDSSGSMALSAATIKKIVKSVPAAVIATYGGKGGEGALRILAKNGLLIHQEELYERIGGCNEVDGPALRWLALQPRPRIWISDGIVTGQGDSPATNLFLDAADICERARIRRVRYLSQAQKLL